MKKVVWAVLAWAFGMVPGFASGSVLTQAGALTAATTGAEAGVSNAPTVFSFANFTFGASPLDGSSASFTQSGSPLTFRSIGSTLFAADRAISTLDELSSIEVSSANNPMKAILLSLGLFLADGTTPVIGDIDIWAMSNLGNMVHTTLSLMGNSQPSVLALGSNNPLEQFTSFLLSPIGPSGTYLSVFSVDADFLYPVMVANSAVPEPGTVWLLLLVLMGLAGLRHRPRYTRRLTTGLTA